MTQSYARVDPDSWPSQKSMLCAVDAEEFQKSSHLAPGFLLLFQVLGEPFA